jgi:simple sugar transport system ATP-binding protein
MVDSYTVADNLILNQYAQPPFARAATIQQAAIAEHAEKLVKKFDVRTPSIETPGGSLSGGNQQKMVVAREFSRPIQLLIAAQPTRGIDVGSIEFIHQQIVAKRDEGVAVLLVSAELDEILALSDRIAVIYQGRILDVVDRAAATREGLGLLMAGVKGEPTQDVR